MIHVFYMPPAPCLRPELPIMARIGLKSMLRFGHQPRLHVYQSLSNIPDGVVVCNANDTVPEFHSLRFARPSQFFDYFCFCLLEKTGGWVMGADMALLRHLDFDDEYVFATDDIPKYYITNGPIKMPKGCSLSTDCRKAIEAMDLQNQDWAATGPLLLHSKIIGTELEKFVKHGNTFDLVPYTRLGEIVKPGARWNFEGAYCIHFRQSIWDDGPNSKAAPGLYTDRAYPKGCLWENLKERYA